MKAFILILLILETALTILGHNTLLFNNHLVSVKSHRSDVKNSHSNVLKTYNSQYKLKKNLNLKNTIKNKKFKST